MSCEEQTVGRIISISARKCFICTMIDQGKSALLEFRVV